jgi:hypothetical protein
MVDVLGTTASLIAIAGAVIELIKHAKTFFRAKPEFDVLQARTRSFQRPVHYLTLRVEKKLTLLF